VKILLISSRFQPHRGGLEKVVHHLAYNLKEAGHQIKIITNRYPRSLPSHEISDGLDIARFHFLFPEKDYLKFGRVDLWLAGLWFSFWTKFRLKRVIEDFQPDLINNHYLNVVADFTAKVLEKLDKKIPWVISLHGGDVDGEPLQNIPKRQRFMRVSQQADCITACSQSLADQAVDLNPSLVEKIRVVHNGVDVERFSQIGFVDQKEPYIFAVGQLVRHKGLDMLVKAFAAVCQQFPEISLRIAGSGPEQENLSKLITSLGMERNIILLGSQPEEDVARLMCGSIFVAVPSRREPFGIVALEAMAAGKNLLVTPVGGIPEFVPPGPNLFMQPRLEDWIDGLGEFIQLWKENALPDPKENIRAAGELTWDRYTEKILEIYRDAQ